jgi:hypothetical protein
VDPDPGSQINADLDFAITTVEFLLEIYT